MKNLFQILTIFYCCISVLNAQTDKDPNVFSVTINGEKYDAIVENGDTIIFAQLKEIHFTAPPTFANDNERFRYKLYKRYASIVYPYAVKAVRIFKETEYVTQNMNKRDRKAHIKILEKRLEEEFEEPLKKLTKLQGMMLVKMIERELDTPMYDLIAGLRGRFTAMYYSTVGLMYDYNLTRGYRKGDDPLLDVILEDFKINYDLKEQIQKNKKKQNTIVDPSGMEIHDQN